MKVYEEGYSIFTKDKNLQGADGATTIDLGN